MQFMQYPIYLLWQLDPKVVDENTNSAFLVDLDKSFFTAILPLNAIVLFVLF